ncbi:MAG: hypothetical protein GY830_03885 [Bacteroidetes bacterium]|nr:hypothetical protein [Bacteroidota bacterium]
MFVSKDSKTKQNIKSKLKLKLKNFYLIYEIFDDAAKNHNLEGFNKILDYIGVEDSLSKLIISNIYINYPAEYFESLIKHQEKLNLNTFMQLISNFKKIIIDKEKKLKYRPSEDGGIIILTVSRNKL